MASKKIPVVNASTAIALVHESDAVREATPTNNLVDAEQVLREGLVDLARIKSLLYGEEDELVPPPEPKCMANSTWNVKVLAEMTSEVIGDILRRL